MRFVLLLALLAPLASAQTQTALYPGQSGAALLSSIRSGYTPSQTLGYDAARDQLYAYEQQTKGELCGVYTQFCIQLTPGADPSSDAISKGINAEHTWPQSRGASSEPARSDLHHLFPSKATANSARGSDPLLEIPDADTDAWYRGPVSQTGTPAARLEEWSEDDNTPSGGFLGAFEPRDDHKGDAARALFYFRTIYAAQTSGQDAFFDAMKDDLIVWHYADPVSPDEAARSSWIAGRQGRENPFVLDSTLARRAYNLSASTGGGGGGGGTGTGGGPIWVNEIHYDNAGSDADEGVEVAGRAGTSLAGWSLVFYNGSNGTVYETVALSGVVPDQQGGHGTVWTDVPGLQNGGPDGVALVAPDGSVAEFLSYEGTFTASDGPAAGTPSVDIGVAEGSSTPAGVSLQLVGTGAASGDFAWADEAAHTRGAPNTGQTFEAGPVVWINEIHYDNVRGDRYEGAEVAGPAGLDLTGWSLAFYNGRDGSVYATAALSGAIDDEGAGFGAVWTALPDMQNGDADGIAIVDASGAVVQFLSYEGVLTAADGPAAGLTSEDIGQSESGSTPRRQSLQLAGTGTAYADFAWAPSALITRDRVNGAQTFGTAKTGAPLFRPRLESASRGATLYPNPTRGRATVSISLDAPTDVRADVFDALGRRVASVDAGDLQAGTQSLDLDLTAMPPGIYVVRVTAGDAVQTTRLTVAR